MTDKELDLEEKQQKAEMIKRVTIFEYSSSVFILITANINDCYLFTASKVIHCIQVTEQSISRARSLQELLLQSGEAIDSNLLSIRQNKTT